MDFLKELAKQMSDEIDGYTTYKKLADMTDNIEQKQKLIDISNQEKMHYETIKGILESYM